ncbi:MAG: hypothetical protein GXO65_00275 [Euryarchaeota archaeon]|nr:hypothetical protein [Euryarchaeota archaeon]
MIEMDKEDFIDRLYSSETKAARNRMAEERSQGLVRFQTERDVPTPEGPIDLCEICLHPKGRTFNVMEVCPSFDGGVLRIIDDFEKRCRAYFEARVERGEHPQLVKNIVIPPDPGMIMELGKHVEKLLELGDFTVTVYDPESDKMGACPLDRDFLESLKEDPDYEGMELSEIFSSFLMGFSELL